jgi:short-subunit dehydrogenase
MVQKTALITGASAGIGMEFARVFARNGFDLVLVARRREAMDALAEEVQQKYQRKVFVIAEDLSQPEAVQRIDEILQKQSIEVDVLVNNAGIGDFGLFHDTDLARQTHMIDLNIRALTSLTHIFGKKMVQRRQGYILNVASTAAFQPGPWMSVYFASKHYVLAFSEALASEWSDYGVVVSTLCPGATQSEFQNASAMQESALFKGKRIPSSEEVAVYGYNALMNGKTVAVHGWQNWLLTQSVRFAPRKLATYFARKAMEPARTR